MRIFKEEQRFTQKWLIILLSISAVVPLVIISKIYFEGQMNLAQFTGTTALVLASIGLIFIIKLETRIDEIGVHYQFFPFHLKMKTIFWKDVKFSKTRTYNA